ncbi:response regulator transcription factor [Pedobacter mucosus]|uniref:response regulator transcription factor n=1 Tax=Pedobacter mucosus TaxID=2895286 RepID=UPI001EE4DA88|nr:response regulator [Pedobacter mucosus]UKT66029.1 response regulator [Pedobacter mucosus]
MNKILVIDDDPPTLDAIKLLFEMENYDVIALDSCTDLLKVLAAFEPDIILMDVILGTVDGRTVCKELKSLYNIHIPVILMSVVSSFQENTFIPLCSDDFINKPFDLELMLSKVEYLLNRSRMTII